MRGAVVVLLVGAIAGALVAASCLRPAKAPAAAHPPPAAAAPPPRARLVVPDPAEVKVAVDVRGEWSWALRELGSGAVVGDGTLRTTAGAVIRSWLAVDFLAARGSRVSAADAARLDRLVRAGDDRVAQTLYRRLGGDRSLARMIRTCGLRETRIQPGRWAGTTMSATDATLLGRCVARGPGLSPPWRAKLLDLMRPAAPGDASGIPDAPALAGRHLAVGNGWTRRGTWWTVGCLAVWDHWVLAVLVHYPDQGDGHRYGADVCKAVAQQLFEPGFAPGR
ncbi:serine hydrolase [Amycolatopsis vancoresmycina]|uniref:serine hydrolase n=1 Tax=Amycolatopsis vancoresmycina TaxID=208444 RepID=UPI000527EAD7|nr:serine hydrolase [Amycolatopsis vancoresmycina]